MRLIRAIEIAKALGKVPPLRASRIKKNHSTNFIQIGLLANEKTLREKIATRLDRRLKKSMLAEATRLHKNGLTWKRMEALGLEYRFMALYLQNKLTRAEMIEKSRQKAGNMLNAK